MTEPKVQRRVGNWVLLEQIGSGSFAVVWKARHVDSGMEAAVKEINIDKLNKKLQESLASEISVLHRTQHPNVIALLDVLKEGATICLVLEFCSGGDLAQFLKRHVKVSEQRARYVPTHALPRGCSSLPLPCQHPPALLCASPLYMPSHLSLGGGYG